MGEKRPKGPGEGREGGVFDSSPLGTPVFVAKAVRYLHGLNDRLAVEKEGCQGARRHAARAHQRPAQHNHLAEAMMQGQVQEVRRGDHVCVDLWPAEGGLVQLYEGPHQAAAAAGEAPTSKDSPFCTRKISGA